MEVKFLTSLAGVNFSYSAGDVAELKKEEAKRLVDAGYAELVKGEVAAKDLKKQIKELEAKLSEAEVKIGELEASA